MSDWLEIHDAASSGTIDWVRQLIDAGHQINARTRYGVTPLIAAVTWQKYEIAREFIQAGCDTSGIASSYAKVLDFEKSALSPEFQAALAELARLCQTKATPHSEERHDGPFTWPGTYVCTYTGEPLRLAKDARTFVMKHKDDFNRRGSLLFRNREDLALAPTTDKFAVIAMFGLATHAQGNFNTFAGAPAQLEQLISIDQLQPFDFIGRTDQELELAFRPPIQNADALAQAIGELAYDNLYIVNEHRKGHVSAIAQELAQSATIRLVYGAEY